MVKSGVDDATVTQAIRNARAVDFDMSDAGQQALTSGGASPEVLAAMKTRAAHARATAAHAASTHATHAAGK